MTAFLHRHFSRMDEDASSSPAVAKDIFSMNQPPSAYKRRPWLLSNLAPSSGSSHSFCPELPLILFFALLLCSVASPETGDVADYVEAERLHAVDATVMRTFQK